jgi:DNA-binding NarL/FixJ family response regulator
VVGDDRVVVVAFARARGVVWRVSEDGVSPDDLTDREREVLRHLALGESNKAIGEVLCVSEETVKTHVGHILGKLGVENRAQAVVQALKRGLVSLEEIG